VYRKFIAPQTISSASLTSSVRISRSTPA